VYSRITAKEPGEFGYSWTTALVAGAMAAATRLLLAAAACMHAMLRAAAACCCDAAVNLLPALFLYQGGYPKLDKDFAGYPPTPPQNSILINKLAVAS
jgi:hypothetical protein